MRYTMADDSPEFNLFSAGSTIYVKTCFDQELEGEVIAFDFQTKLLVLKCSSSNGKSNVNDVHMINLDYVEDIVVKKEVATATTDENTTLGSLNIEKLTSRAKQHIKERQRLVAALSSGVSPEGVKLLLAITKTITEVTLQGKNIVVMNEVTITPPYRPENCNANKMESDALNHVRKIVEKYMKDQQGQSPSAANQQQTKQMPSPLQS